MGGPSRRISDSSSSSSSEEDDGDAEWKAAIESIAAITTFPGSNGFTSSLSNAPSMTTTIIAKTIEQSSSYAADDEDEDTQHQNPQKLKHYQVKAQKLLDGILEKTLEIVKDPAHVPDNDQMMNDDGVRLFKHSPLGIVFDHVDEIQGPKKRPRILPGKEIDEKSKKYKRQLQSIAVDGENVIAAARDARQKSLARLEARDAAAKEKAKREEERIAELKRMRGERWLPSIAKEMQPDRNGRQPS